MDDRLIPINSGIKSKHLDVEAGRAALDDTSYFANQRGVVLFNDMCRPMSDQTLQLFQSVECVCSLPAWQNGFPVFAERAGIKQTGSHHDYLTAIGRLIRTLGKPTYIVSSKRHAMTMGAQFIRPIKLYDEATVVLAEWQPLGADGVGLDRAEDVAPFLAKRYRSVLDFSCGYGSVLRHFDYFVGADIDTKCLNYIEREIMR